MKSIIQYINGSFHIHRLKIFSLYVGAYCIVVPIFTMLFYDGFTAEYIGVALVYFPIGISLLLSDPSTASGPDLAIGYLTYLALLISGIVTKKRWVYLIFILILLINIGGCMALK